MAGSISGLHLFANDVGPDALSLFDSNFSSLSTALNTLSTFANSYADTGAVNSMVITVSSPQVVAAYTDGLLLQVKAANTNTSTTPTLTVNSLGAKTIVNPDGSAVSIGALPAGGWVTLQYDGTSGKFMLLGGLLRTLSAPGSGICLSLTEVSGAASPALQINSAAQADSPQAWFSRPVAGVDAVFGTVGTSGNLVTGSAAGDTVIRGANGAVWLASALANGGIKVSGSGATQQIQGWGPVQAALVDMTPDKGSWVSTITGPWTNVVTFKWERQGTQCTVWTDSNALGTASSASTMSLSGLPAAVTPSSARNVLCSGLQDNGGGSYAGAATVNAGGTITVGMAFGIGSTPNIRLSGPSAFTNGAQCGLNAGWSITYSL